MLAVEFEPPYWGVLRFELRPDGAATDVRVTQRGFEGNEEWLADFRGGWGSFNDRLAVLCEIGVIATPRHIEPTRAVGAHARARRAAGALAQLAVGGCRRSRTGTRTAAASRWSSLAPTPATATASAASEACDALCVDVPPATDLQAARASLVRSLPRRGWTAAGPLRASVDPGHPEVGTELALPYRPALEATIPSPSCARSSGRSARPAAPRPPPTSLRAARSRWPAGRTRARSTRHSRACPRERSRASGACAGQRRSSHRRLGRRRLDGRPQPRHEHVDVRRGRPHRTARPALRSGRAAHGRRMTDAWVAALRAALGDRVHTQPAELAAVARDASHVIGKPEALLYPETTEHVAAAVRIAREHGVPSSRAAAALR